MSLMQDFREALASAVETATGIKVKHGYFDGPVRNGNLGCCYTVGVQENPANVTEQLLEVHIRLFLRYDQQPDPEVPMDGGPLEDLVEACQVALSALPQNYGGVWFARLKEAEINMAQYGVAMLFEGTAWNKFAVVAP